VILSLLQETLSNYTASVEADRGEAGSVAYASFQRVSQRPTDGSEPYAHYIDDHVVEGSCVDWLNYWDGGALEEQLYGKIPAMITVFVARAETPGGVLEAQLTDPRNVTCAESPDKVKAIIEQLTQTASTISSDAISCGGREWVVKGCSDSGSPSLCVDCSQDMIDSMCDTATTGQDLSTDMCDIGNDNDYADDSGAIYIGPCQQSLCSLRRAHSMGHLIISRSDPMYTAPSILSNTTVTADRHSIEVKVKVDGEGTVTCNAYTGYVDSGGGPSNVNQVLLQGVSSPVVFNVSSGEYGAVVVISNDVIASTDYYTYCVTTSVLGDHISYSDMVEQSEANIGMISTECCRQVTASFRYYDIIVGDEDELVNSVLDVTVEGVPGASLKIAALLASSSTGSTYDIFAPKFRSLSPSSATSQLISTMGMYFSTSPYGTDTGVNYVPVGDYTVQLSLSGAASRDYEVTYES
jgi:hypothetical protein